MGLGSVVQYIPLAVLSGILILTGIGMFDWGSMKKMHVAPKGDVVVMFVTMIVTVKFDLMIAVAFGIILSFIIYMVKCKERETSIVKKRRNVHNSRAALFPISRSYFLYFTRCEVTGCFTYERCALYGCIRSYDIIKFC